MTTKLMNKILYWVPRAIAIAFTIFAYSIIIEDLIKGSDYLIIIGHLIPGTIILFATITAWRYRAAGAMMFFAWGIFYVLMSLKQGVSIYALLIMAGIPFLIGLLFLLEHFRD